MGGCVHPSQRAGGTMWGRWSQGGRGLRAEDHRSCQQRSLKQGGVPNTPPSLHTPSDLPGASAAGARTEGRRQGSLGDPAPGSSPGGAVGERGWSVALEDRGVTTGARTPVPGPHQVPSWLSPESPPPTESGLGTRLCYEHSVDEPHGRAGKSDSLSPQENQT